MHVGTFLILFAFYTLYFGSWFTSYVFLQLFFHFFLLPSTFPTCLERKLFKFPLSTSYSYPHVLLLVIASQECHQIHIGAKDHVLYFSLHSFHFFPSLSLPVSFSSSTKCPMVFFRFLVNGLRTSPDRVILYKNEYENDYFGVTKNYQ